MLFSKQTHKFDYFICYHLESGWHVTRPNQGLSLGRGKSLGTSLKVWVNKSRPRPLSQQEGIFRCFVYYHQNKYGKNESTLKSSSKYYYQLE